MKKTVIYLVSLAAVVVGLWFLLHGQKPQPVEPIRETPVAPPEEPAVKKEGFMSALLKAMEQGATREQPAVSQSAPPATSTPVTGGAITGRVYDAISDKGIEGAIVYAVLNGQDVASSEPTDGSGRYRILNLAAGTYEVRYRDARGYPDQALGQQHQVTISGGQSAEGVDFALIPGIRVAGKVVDHQGLPAEGAAVIAEHIGDKSNIELARSKADGSFEFCLQRPTTLMLKVRKGSYRGSRRPFEVPAEGIEDLIIELNMPLTASISGIVVDGMSHPIADALVYYFPGGRTGYPPGPNTTIITRSAQDGSFTLRELAAGSYMLLAAAPNLGYLLENAMRVQVQEGEAMTGLRLVLGSDQGGLAIEGRVVDASGNPVSGVVVQCSGQQASKQALSGEDGSFRFTGLEDREYSLSVDEGDSPTSPRPVFVSAQAGSKDVVITLKGKGDIEGRVLRADTGEPLARFQVYLAQGHRTRVDPTLLTDGRSVGDAEGRFKFEQVSAGDYAVTARAPGFAPGFMNVTLAGNQTLSDVELRLQPGEALRGRVVNAARLPVSGAVISLGYIVDLNRPRNIVARSGSDGAFVIEDFPPDAHWVMAYHPDYAPGASRVSDNTVIVLENWSRLEGVITGGGPPTAGVQINLMYLSDIPRNLGQFARAGADGTFSFEKLMPGSVRVMAMLAPWRISAQYANLAPGQTTHVELALGSGTATLEGRVTMQGEPPMGVDISLRVQTADSEETYQTATGSDGTYRLTGLPAGQAFLTAQAYTRDRTPRSRALEVTLTDGEVTRQDVDLGAGGRGQITGRFLGMKPGFTGMATLLSGAVSVSTPWPQSDVWRLAVGRAICDSDGNYQVQNVEPGTYTLAAQAGPRDGDMSEHMLDSRVVTIRGEETVNVDFDFR